MKTTTERTIFWMLAVAAGFLLFACATAGPSPELVDARRVYDHARVGKAGQLVPDQLVDARRALDRAESAHRDDPGSYRERSLAYVAARQAQIAMANAETIADRLAIKRAEVRYQEELKRDAANKSAQLEAKEATLNLTRGQLDRTQAQLQTKERQLQQAENQVRAAVESLEKVAQIREEQRELVITLSGEVLFEYNRAVLLPIARERLTEVATALKEIDGASIVIEGHTDAKGSDAVNQRLSQARAEAVLAFLVSQGVDPSQLRAVGKGEGEPIAENRTAEGRANNRRVEIHVRRPTELGAR